MVFLTRPEAPGDDFSAYVDQERAAWGFVPNYAACFAARPEVAMAWKALNLTIGAGMDRRTDQLASIAVARTRRSSYCTVAHSKFLRDVCDDAASVAVIDTEPDGGALPSRDAAVYRFAQALATDASSITAADIDALHEQGLADDDIANVVYAAAARMFFTTVLDGLGARLDLQTAAEFAPDLLQGMLVGRPPAEVPSAD